MYREPELCVIMSTKQERTKLITAIRERGTRGGDVGEDRELLIRTTLKSGHESHHEVSALSVFIIDIHIRAQRQKAKRDPVQRFKGAAGCESSF